MPVLLWIGFASCIISAVFLLFVIAFGLVAAVDPKWDHVQQEAANDEAARRGLVGVKLTSKDLEARKTLLEAASPSPLDPTADQRLVSALRALTKATDDEVEALVEKRGEVLTKAVERQRRTVRRITLSNKWAANVWLISTIGNRACAGLAGLKWLLPLFFRRMRKIAEPYLATSTLAGVWVGLLWWGFTQFNDGQSDVEWLNVVGIVVTLSSVGGLLASIIVQIHRLLVVVHGPIKTWSFRGVLTAIILLTLVSSAISLFFSGKMSSLSDAFSQWTHGVVRKIDIEEGWLGFWFTLGACLLLVFYLVYRFFSKELILRDRIESLITAILFGLISFGLVAFVIDITDYVVVLCGWGIIASMIMLILNRLIFRIY